MGKGTSESQYSATQNYAYPGPAYQSKYSAKTLNETWKNTCRHFRNAHKEFNSDIDSDH